jgi:hypothetical protein
MMKVLKKKGMFLVVILDIDSFLICENVLSIIRENSISRFNKTLIYSFFKSLEEGRKKIYK